MELEDLKIEDQKEFLRAFAANPIVRKMEQTRYEWQRKGAYIQAMQVAAKIEEIKGKVFKEFIRNLDRSAERVNLYDTKMTKEQLISLVSSSANLIDERDDIVAYIDSLDGVNGKTEQEIKDGYEVFKSEKFANELIAIAETHKLSVASLQSFVHTIVDRKIFDGEKLSELVAPLELGWKDRTKKETAIMTDLIPLLKRMAEGQKISGLSAYE